MNILTEQEDEKIMRLKKLIRETPVEVDLANRIMENYTNKHMQTHRVTRQRRGFRRALIFMTLACSMFIVITATAFISPTMAESLKQIPGMNSVFQFANDLGLNIADEKGLFTDVDASDTHEGLTVKATAVSFDGTRVSLGIENEFLDNSFDNKLQINDVNMFINGESIKSYSPSGNSSGVFMFPIPDKDMMILEFGDTKNQGGKLFPKEFELSLEITVSGIQDRFKLNVPVKMNTEDNLVLTPSLERSYENLNLNFERIEFTPITTILTTQVELPEKMKIDSNDLLKSIGYDLFDDKGNKANLIYGNGWSETDGNILITDIRFEPFVSRPNSVTLKPYKFVYKDNSESEFQLDDDGDIKIEYIPELEMTLPIKLN